MKQLKKTILTLVALLAVTTGAWADETLLLTINSTDNASFKSGSKTFDDKVTVTFSNGVGNDGDTNGWFSGGKASLLTVAGINGYTITSCKFYTDGGTAATGYTVAGESPSVYLSQGQVYTDASKSVLIGYPGVNKIEVFGGVASSSSGPEVAWNAAAKTGTFTMPGGNVTLEPEYYPQATVAEGAVTAADADARATTDDPLVKVDATKLTGAKKLMYFVSNSGTTAPAYDAEGWTDQLPTAEGITQQGIVYVWYYPVGTDEGVDDATATYSDGDICLQSITARIAPEPTYAVTFAEGTDPNEWTASPAAGVKKGTAVTVTYTGAKKVIGVKAEKKAAAPASTPLDNTMTAWTAGKYAVPAGGLTYSAAITVSGDVTLTLTDGETLTLNKGISLASGATLTVEGNGTMNVNGTNESTASTVAGTGMLVLTSGTLNAKGGNGQSMIINSDGNEPDFNTGASGGVAINGNVTVNGGTVTATGGNGGNLTITGEDDVMDDHGGNGGAAISGSVTVNTGTWTATNGSNGILTLNSETEPEDGNSAGIGGKAVAGTVTDNR